MRRILPLVALLSGCASAPAPVPPLPVGAVPPTLRLPEGVKPVRESVEVTLVPSAPGFDGVATLELEVAQPTRLIWLNGTGLEISEATLAGAPARVVPGGDNYLGFAAASPVGPGRVSLRIVYKGILSRHETSGFFVEESAGEPYIFTQMEATFARRAFPAFDEPSYKIPWHVTVHVPAGQTAIGNMPIASEETKGGTKTVVFAETPPLPAYLVALAVGPLTIIDGGKSAGGVPVRIVVPHDLADQAGYATKTMAEVLSALERFFGVAYPYPKLDLVGIPKNNVAMENVGLITSNVSWMLSRPSEDSLRFRRDFVGLMAHEGGHQWFGDLVTTAWWDDIWLNESFATWVAARVTDEMHPEWHALEEFARERGFAMKNDSGIQARKIRQPIETAGDIETAFDAITYQKGGWVLYMFESWLGRDVFRRGVQKYLHDHAHGNATAADFVAALGAAAGKDLAPAFRSFLDAPGLPEVDVALDCGHGAPSVHLAQRRYLPTGSKGSADQKWLLPVCLRWGSGKSCVLLGEAERDVPLETRTCPAWLAGNDGTGYYRVVYQGDLEERLVEHWSELAPAERLVLADDEIALFQDGRATAKALALVPRLAREESWLAGRRAVDIADLRARGLVSEEARPAFRRWLAATLGPSARRLGWRPRPGESEDATLLRPDLLRLVAGEGADPVLAAEARVLAEAWLSGKRDAFDASVADAIMVAAGMTGDHALFDKARARLKTTTDSHDREWILALLASSLDPAVYPDALALTLSDEVEGREVLEVLFRSGDPRVASPYYAFLRDRFDAIVARLPVDGYRSFLFLSLHLCSTGDAERAARELGPKAKTLPGGERVLAQSLEAMELCAAARAVVAPEVAKVIGAR